MIRVGIAGLGFMGMVHYLTYQKIPDVKVVAICDRSRSKLDGDWTSIRGNFGPPGTVMDLTDVACYESLDELISDTNVDVVDITLPPALHADIAIHSMREGKHVFCEKPMALSLNDCDRMIAASEQANRHLLIGHVLPYFPEYRWAIEVIKSGAYGKLIGGSFKRIISDPSWLTNYWDPSITGGPLLDLHIHDAHLIRQLFGMPTRVSTAGTMRNGLPEQWHSLFEFASPQQFVHVTCGAIPQPNRPFCHGFEIRLEKASLMFEFSITINPQGETIAAYNVPPSILTNDGHCIEAALGEGDPMLAFASEITETIHAVRTGLIPPSLSSEMARDALLICEMEKNSLVENCSI